MEGLMQPMRKTTIVLLTALALAPSSVFASGPQAPDAGSLASVVQQHAAKRDADRQVIRAALTRPQIRAVADKYGFDLDRIAASIDTMSPGDLDRAASAARQMNQQLDQRLVGGDTITISTTAIIIGLLV